MLLLLDQLGGIWEITSRVTLPKSALNWPFNIQRGRREDRPGFASRGSGVRVPLAPLPRNRSSAVVSLASKLIFMRRFSAAVPVACPIGFRPLSRAAPTMRSAAPTLDTAATHLDLAPTRRTGIDQGSWSWWSQKAVFIWSWAEKISRTSRAA